MRALICEQYDQPETLSVQTRDLPAPAPGEVTVEVRSAGVNFPDALMVMGQYQVRPPLPFIPGAEAAGVVSTVGEGVRRLKPGDRVMCLPGTGAFASHVNVHENLCLPMPDGLDFTVAAGLPIAYGTVLHALIQRAQLRSGETLLVLGAAGGVGLAAVMIGKALGARVIAGASTPEKCALAREHGADETFDYTSGDLREQLKTLTGGQGIDVVFDPVGDRYAEPAFRSLGWNGRYLVIGFAGGEIPRLPLNLPLLKGASLVGVFWGEFAKRQPLDNLNNMQRLTDWIAQGQVRPLVSQTRSLEDGPRALRDLLERRVTGKVVLIP